MVSDETYELCLSVLTDLSIDEEDKPDKLEDLLKERTTLSGQSLENAILDALWRFKEGGGNATSPPPIRQTILRRPSPASWRGPSTPLSGSPMMGVSPLASFMHSTLMSRTKSSTASPFGSPRPSPRLAFAAPVPHSPSLSAYQFATDDVLVAPDIFADFPTDNVDWLVSDEVASVTSSVGSSGLNVAAPEFVSSQQSDMTPYDMLRSILGHSRTDQEIDAALATHGYDLGATVAAFMSSEPADKTSVPATPAARETTLGSIVIGKSMTPEVRPTSPADQKTGIICKFFLASGHCLRQDCRFSHDLRSHVCKHWLAGNCLAGATCIFSHDPAFTVNKLQVEGPSTPPTQANINIKDLTSFPALQPGTSESMVYGATSFPATGITPPPGFRGLQSYFAERPRSRPGSRHQQFHGNQKDLTQAAPPIDDADAFPSLGSALARQAKKHHGKRGGHGHKENFVPNTLADIVKMSPSPAPTGPRSPKVGRNGAGTPRNGENSAAAQAIPSPKYIPWLETGERANKAYLRARQEAIKHGSLRNKFLQSAAQAWNRNDARAAKALSLRGQSENDLMRKAHREAARELYEERNRMKSNSPEIYVDLHGLHPEEAVEYLERVLLEKAQDGRAVYAITGTGHHSKNGKDKVGKALRGFLNEWRYAYREFSVPGDRNNMGGILGIDARSWDKSLTRDGLAKEEPLEQLVPLVPPEPEEDVDILAQGVEIGAGKVKLLVRGPAGNKDR